MGTLLKAGILVELEPARVEAGDLRIQDGKIVERGASLAAQPGDEVIDLKGKLVMPGLVCAHQRSHAVYLRGMPGTFAAQEYESAVAHRVKRLAPLLDLDSVQLAAKVSALEALRAGATTVFEQHASPGAVRGSLSRLASAMDDVGLRAVLGYQLSDEFGQEVRDQALEETQDFLGRSKGRLRGSLAADAPAFVSDATLKFLAELLQKSQGTLQLQLAEDPSHERISRDKYGAPPVARLLDAGLLTPRTVLGHMVHLSWPELSQVIATGAWVVHSPRSNMRLQVGYAPAGKFGARATLGTDILSADLWAEVKFAHLRAREAGQPIDPLRYLANGHRLASQVFGLQIGTLEPGWVADLLILDYRPPTPLTAATLASHLVDGMDAQSVESVMVDGLWRMWARRPLAVDPERAATEARQRCTELWARLS